jgi:hypothetical protein
MTEGRCGADINQIREAQPAGELGWLDKFDKTCSADAGHEGAHIFRGEDDQQLHWDEAAKQLGAYQGGPAPEQHPMAF